MKDDKDAVLFVRMTTEEKKHIKKSAADLNMSMTDFIKNATEAYINTCSNYMHATLLE
jgi:uncharacterized protein (DUF1778 family)